MQEINHQLNATLRLNFAPATDYLTRFNTTIAGSNLPDLLKLRTAAAFGAIKRDVRQPLAVRPGGWQHFAQEC